MGKVKKERKKRKKERKKEAYASDLSQ